MEGRYKSSTGMGMGILGARRLMDQFEIDVGAGEGHHDLAEETASGAVAGLEGIRPGLPGLAAILAGEGPQDAFQELQHQNQELLNALEEIRTRQRRTHRL